jgi:hypothetical protein
VREKVGGDIYAMKVLRKDNIIKRNQVSHHSAYTFYPFIHIYIYIYTYHSLQHSAVTWQKCAERLPLHVRQCLTDSGIDMFSLCVYVYNTSSTG